MMRYLALVMLLAAPAPAMASPPEFWGDGLHDDGPALQALVDRCPVINRARPGVLVMTGNFNGQMEGDARFAIKGAVIFMGTNVAMSPFYKANGNFSENKFTGPSNSDDIKPGGLMTKCPAPPVS